MDRALSIGQQLFEKGRNDIDHLAGCSGHVDGACQRCIGSARVQGGPRSVRNPVGASSNVAGSSFTVDSSTRPPPETRLGRMSGKSTLVARRTIDGSRSWPDSRTLLGTARTESSVAPSAWAPKWMTYAAIKRGKV